MSDDRVSHDKDRFNREDSKIAHAIDRMCVAAAALVAASQTARLVRPAPEWIRLAEQILELEAREASKV